MVVNFSDEREKERGGFENLAEEKEERRSWIRTLPAPPLKILAPTAIVVVAINV